MPNLAIFYYVDLSPFFKDFTPLHQLLLFSPVLSLKGEKKSRSTKAIKNKKPNGSSSSRLSISQSSQFSLLQFSSVAQSCPTLCDAMDCSTPGLPAHHQLRSLLRLMSIELVMASIQLILCHSLLIPPSIFPSIRVFSNEPALPIRWLKYWSSSFSISPSSE